MVLGVLLCRCYSVIVFTSVRRRDAVLAARLVPARRGCAPPGPMKSCTNEGAVRHAGAPGPALPREPRCGPCPPGSRRSATNIEHKCSAHSVVGIFSKFRKQSPDPTQHIQKNKKQKQQTTSTNIKTTPQEPSQASNHNTEAKHVNRERQTTPKHNRNNTCSTSHLHTEDWCV